MTSKARTKILIYFSSFIDYTSVVLNVFNVYRQNAEYLQFDWLKQSEYFCYFLIATVQISMECETQGLVTYYWVSKFHNFQIS